MRGRLIVIEGCDGTGKTTQAEKLHHFLEKRRREVLDGGASAVLHLREPGSTALGEAIRNLLLEVPQKGDVAICPTSEAFLFNASRAQLFHEEVLPALEEGCVVVLERFYYSTYAYQGSGLGLNRQMILTMGEWAVEGVLPDRVVLLDMDAAQSLERISTQRDRLESYHVAFHERVRKGFLELAGLFPERFRVINAAGNPEQIHERVVEAVSDVV